MYNLERSCRKAFADPALTHHAGRWDDAAIGFEDPWAYEKMGDAGLVVQCDEHGAFGKHGAVHCLISRIVRRCNPDHASRHRRLRRQTRAGQGASAHVLQWSVRTLCGGGREPGQP